MYFGHICAVVLLPCCHPHCLSCRAFMSCWTNPGSPVQRSCGFCFKLCMCDCVGFLGSTVTLNISFFMLSLPFCWFVSPFCGPALIWLHAFAPLMSESCFGSVTTVSHSSILHFTHLFNTDLWVYTPNPPPPPHPPCDCCVHWTYWPCLWLNLPSCKKYIKQNRNIWNKSESKL